MPKFEKGSEEAKAWAADMKAKREKAKAEREAGTRPPIQRKQGSKRKVAIVNEDVVYEHHALHPEVWDTTWRNDWETAYKQHDDRNGTKDLEAFRGRVQLMRGRSTPVAPAAAAAPVAPVAAPAVAPVAAPTAASLFAVPGWLYEDDSE